MVSGLHWLNLALSVPQWCENDARSVSTLLEYGVNIGVHQQIDEGTKESVVYSRILLGYRRMIILGLRRGIRG